MTEHSDVVRVQLFVVQRRWVYEKHTTGWAFVTEYPGGKPCPVCLSAEEAAHLAGAWADEGRFRGFCGGRTECRVLALETPAAVVKEIKG